MIKSILYNCFRIAITLLFICWLIVFFDVLLWLPIVENINKYKIIAVIIVISPFLIVYKAWDLKLMDLIFSHKKVSNYLVIFLISAWLLILVSWVISINGFQDSDKAFRFGIALAILGFPSSIIGTIFDSALSFVLTNLNYKTRIIISWISYFIPYLVQLYLVRKYIHSIIKQQILDPNK